jgi:hypothetical protein
MDCGCGRRRAWVRRQLLRASPRAERLTDHQVTAITFAAAGLVAGAAVWLLGRGELEEHGYGGGTVQH